MLSFWVVTFLPLFHKNKSMKHTYISYYFKEKTRLTGGFCPCLSESLRRPLLQIEMERTNRIFHTRIRGPVTGTWWNLLYESKLILHKLLARTLNSHFLQFSARSAACALSPSPCTTPPLPRLLLIYACVQAGVWGNIKQTDDNGC